MTLGIILGIELTPARESAAILIMAASIRAGQSWDLRLPYASLRVTLRVGTQKQLTFMHLLTGLRLQHPPRGQAAQNSSSGWVVFDLGAESLKLLKNSVCIVLFPAPLQASSP